MMYAQGLLAAVEQFRQQGGHVCADDSLLQSPTRLGEMLPADVRLEPACDRVALGHFSREGKTVLVAVNVGREAFAGRGGHQARPGRVSNAVPGPLKLYLARS